MYVCVPCDKSFVMWRRFKQHMLDSHRVNERNLIRRVSQLDALQVFAVESDGGQWFVFGQPSMF